jgi:hypothetical protein
MQLCKRTNCARRWSERFFEVHVDETNVKALLKHLFRISNATQQHVILRYRDRDGDGVKGGVPEQFLLFDASADGCTGEFIISSPDKVKPQSEGGRVRHMRIKRCRTSIRWAFNISISVLFLFNASVIVLPQIMIEFVFRTVQSCSQM